MEVVAHLIGVGVQDGLHLDETGIGHRLLPVPRLVHEDGVVPCFCGGGTRGIPQIHQQRGAIVSNVALKGLQEVQDSPIADCAELTWCFLGLAIVERAVRSSPKPRE